MYTLYIKKAITCWLTFNSGIRKLMKTTANMKNCNSEDKILIWIVKLVYATNRGNILDYKTFPLYKRWSEYSYMSQFFRIPLSSAGLALHDLERSSHMISCCAKASTSEAATFRRTDWRGHELGHLRRPQFSNFCHGDQKKFFDGGESWYSNHCLKSIRKSIIVETSSAISENTKSNLPCDNSRIVIFKRTTRTKWNRLIVNCWNRTLKKFWFTLGGAQWAFR